MNVDADIIYRWAQKNKIHVYDDKIHTNDHNRVTNEKVIRSISEFRSSFRDFLMNSPQKHLVFTISTHGTPYKYVDNNGIEVQGEEIVIGNGLYYKDK